MRAAHFKLDDHQTEEVATRMIWKVNNLEACQWRMVRRIEKEQKQQKTTEK